MDIELSQSANILINILTKSGFQGYAVGGCVRDSIMKKTPFDFDITTNASTEDMLRLFSNFRCLTQGAKHGTVAVIVDGETVECTTFRIDGTYSDSRHPDKVTFSAKLSDDLSRRDFTINALAYNKSCGIIDLFGGISDISSKIIKAIGDPDRRFTEDGLRIMRAMRFSSTLGFEIEKNTAESMKKNSNRLLLVSRERITEEFEKMLVGENIQYVFENFSDIFKVILCGEDICEFAVTSIELCPRNFDIRLFALIKNSKQPMQILENSRLIIKKSDKRTICQLLQMTEPKNKKDIKLLMSRFDTLTVRKYLQFLNDDSLCEQMSEVLNNNECFSVAQLEIDGKDLENLGFHGKDIRIAKERILSEIIDGKIDNRKNEILRYLRDERND